MKKRMMKMDADDMAYPRMMYPHMFVARRAWKGSPLSSPPLFLYMLMQAACCYFRFFLFNPAVPASESRPRDSPSTSRAAPLPAPQGGGTGEVSVKVIPFDGPSAVVTVTCTAPVIPAGTLTTIWVSDQETYSEACVAAKFT